MAPPPAGLPASIKKDICPNRALDQYIHTNTGTSFVRSSQQSTWGTVEEEKRSRKEKKRHHNAEKELMMKRELCAQKVLGCV